MHPSMHDAPGHDLTSRWGGYLVAFGAVGVVVAIVLYLTSGAVGAPDASFADVAAGISGATTQLTLMAYLSIVVDVAFLLGAVLLAMRPATTPGQLAARCAWALAAVASLLIVQFDLIFPHAIIPLAQNHHEAPLLFEAVYRASNFVHSVGLFFAYGSFLALFVVEARRDAPAVPRAVAYTAILMWSLGLVVAVGLMAERPLIMIAPSILVGWLLVAYLGMRTASRPQAEVVTSTTPATGTR